MDELYRAADKLFDQVDHLERLLDSETIDPGTVELALSVAKRVRRDSTLLVRHLAAHRDQLQP